MLLVQRFFPGPPVPELFPEVHGQTARSCWRWRIDVQTDVYCGEEFERFLSWPEGRKTSTMNRTRALRVDGGEMLRRAVAFVIGKTVAGIHLVEFHHQAVARHFREHAG